MSNSARPDRCPICGKPPAAPHAPFCGQGCRDRDLLAWLGESYRIPARETGEDGLDSPPRPPL
ncbi:DNA gyrase inhibitor YacG [Sphingomonas flavalba]|uniref:DNA gyrase inhibitor YacG n=1 Tax=Sphingomonas flavalba TaxID=2559804 RepID=UPI0039E1F3E6